MTDDNEVQVLPDGKLAVTEELTARQGHVVPPVPIEPRGAGGLDVGALMMRAVEAQAPIEYMERLIAIADHQAEKHAERAYYAAKAAAQAEFPPIPKRKEVKARNGEVMYRYAPLDDTVTVIAPCLARHGLSFGFDTKGAESGVEVICTGRHEQGHEETATVFVPGVKLLNTNAAQNAGGAITYGKRHAFQNLWGIVHADEDVDGHMEQQLDQTPITEEQAAAMQALIDEIKEFKQESFLRWVSKLAGGEVAHYEFVPMRIYDEVIRELERARQRS